MELTIRWEYYPAHRDKNLILKRPVDIYATYPERQTHSPNIQHLVLKRYGITYCG